MSDLVQLSERQNLPPPPAPPLPPRRLGQLQRIIAPWGKHIGAKSHGSPAQGDGDRALRQITGIHNYSPSLSQTATHRTGIPIAALDINQSGTHAILAGKEILKTVHVHEGKVTEDLNLRAAINSYASAYTSPQSNRVSKRREYLPARDVRWSTGDWAHIIATAATNGRIALYDLKASGLKTELAWLHEHTGQINKLDFDPFAGYLLLSASQDKSVRLWDMREPKPEKSRLRFDIRSAVRDVRWSPVDPLDFAICADGGMIQKWDARNPSAPKLSISGHEKACYSLDWHPDGRHVISGGFDKFARVWDFQSDNRRQKPVLQFRAPHAIRNIRWRPVCEVSDTTGSTHWQSTQVAISYYHEDPRLHIWDLRRPQLPFRELDRFDTPANDLLWASKDMLWSVGDQGVFTQWDVKHVMQLCNQLPPSASVFMPDGEYYTFSEDRESQRLLERDNAALGFLSIPQDKMSGGDDGAISRSLTDDEGLRETTNASNSRRHDRGAVSSKSNKSQANSPPSADDKSRVIPLDQTVVDRPGLLSNDQVGAAGYIQGVAAEPEIVEYLASNYASPATEDEKMRSPDDILRRLEDAFHQNAAACDAVSMHRMSQSWRILAAIIIPELKDWADANRAKRRADAARRRQALENFRSGASSRPGLSPLAGLPHRGFTSKGESKSHHLMSSLFKGVAGTERKTSGMEMDSTSNMTTPLVKPLPDSPASGRKRWSQTSSEDSIDDMAPLPPSIWTSHSTAAAAARALLDNEGQVTTSAPSSPEIVRPRLSPRNQPRSEPVAAINSPVQPAKESPRNGSGAKAVGNQQQTHEERRAALKDYRAQVRPIFTLEESTNTPASDGRHDSGESFPMFSASTDSSHKARSLGRSLESPHGGGRVSSQSEKVDHDTDLDEDSEDPSPQKIKSSRPRLMQEPSDMSEGQESRDSGVETPLDMSFGGYDASDAVIQPSVEEDKTQWHAQPEQELPLASQLDTAMSSSPDIFHFEESASIVRPQIHTSNPMRLDVTKDASTNDAPKGSGLSSIVSIDELDSEAYVYQDFRPIDLSRYEPKLPFAWSSLPLICQSIAYDVDNGIGHGQFAAHLLMHIHPYFFHASFRKLQRAEQDEVERLADRLMTPHIGHRIIESIFEQHLSFLKQMGIHQSAALVRKVCVELDYPRFYKTVDGNNKAGASLTDGDPATLTMVCSTCQGPMASGQNSVVRQLYL
ncbi:SEA (Seh1-associated) complex subunit [Elasticomyces elasticus]|uniref:SEA (Seh1-associated) complex subunit n=1 Tax=Exophiala sideris TaxID=1016849 RepID=A0ABR0IZD3_9EURO|nr:SEA (Seh1-associated) complex subunit [Elasticomyces elasticus]KAK5022889.1 SEA (Seh1-associated) complex subunit [Exophiala sideris]KAK5023962.1 SEA (Seh1-associated) complex subunit [Exophiala sideris]KAK5052367.1 SEA (Seh1-associated) complex subunit [Exophiala sideris]KAK5176276.1 SEA (Seh1-associated) complex subunit [Eurotiomycetes sp. CCFEE 6388]